MTGHGSMQADMVLGKALRIIHLDPQAAERECCTGHGLSIYKTSKPAPIVIPFSNKATPTPTRLYLLIVQSLWGKHSNT